MSSARLRTCYAQAPSSQVQGQVLTRASAIHGPSLPLTMTQPLILLGFGVGRPQRASAAASSTEI